jgi:hypothetical protein
MSMKRRHLLLAAAAPLLSASAGCTTASGGAGGKVPGATTPTGASAVHATLAPPPPASDLDGLSTEFASGQDLTGWIDLRQTEGGPNWIKRLDADQTVPGSLYLEPSVCGWFDSYRGVLLYREVTGDAVLHLRLRASGVYADDPTSIYSLGGAMLRVPEPANGASRTDIASWAFITVGAGDQPRQVETKTTVNGLSELVLHGGRTGWAEVVLARIGSAVVTAYRPDGAQWRVMSRWSRPDLPVRLQWGICAYTDWRSFNGEASAVANAQAWPGRPDLRLSVDFAHFYRPAPAPSALNLTDANLVADADLLTAIIR